MRKVILIVGASGSGKSTLEKGLVTFNPNQYYKAVSCTTREPRAGESNGKEYFFVTKEDFLSKTDLMEQVEFAGNHYGLEASQIHSEKDTVVVVEPNGARGILEYIKKNQLEVEPMLIYMDIPKNIRKTNMLKRGDSPESVEKRLREEKIVEDFKSLDLKADLTIKKLTPFLPLKVDEWIRVSRLI